jgi:hypothetical protein
MGVMIKPSDLRYKYPRNRANKEAAKFCGKPDPAPFDRDDLWELLPMFEAVMDALGSTEGQVLHQMEELVNTAFPRFLVSREEVFDYLVGAMGEILRED